jgi:hypothetical protein
MNGRVGLCLVGMLGAISASCGDPDQLYRHRDAGTSPPVTGAAGSGGAAGALVGSAGSSGSGTAGASGGTAGAIAGTGGAAGTTGSSGTSGSTGTAGASGASGTNGTGGASGSNGSAGASGSTGNAGATGSAGAGGSTGADASADGMPACTSTPDCHCDYYGGHAYKFCGNGRGYTDAVTACAMQGMRLMRVDDEGENAWAFNNKMMRGFPGVWIGADDMAATGTWRWSDGTTFWMGKAGAAGAGPVNGLFNAWAPSQPDNQNGNEHCADYDSGTDRWSDVPCTNHNAYICELY